MSIEYIRFKIDEELQIKFIRAVGEACKIMAAYPDCLNYEVTQCEEDITLFVWRITWTSSDAHLNGFRKDKIFEPFYELMQPFIGYMLEMNHHNKII